MKSFILIITLVISSYYLAKWIESVATFKTQYISSSKNQIDTFFYHFKTILANKKGHIKHTIEGEKLTHIENANALINLPILQIHEEDKIEWNVTSATAEIIKENNNIAFNKNVVMTNTSDADDHMVLKTDKLDFYTDKKIMKTDKPVSVQTAQSYTTAIGMIANSKQQNILLMEQVRATYEN